MVEEKQLNLTEILTALQDFMTQDGSISQEQREFYKTFRSHLNEHEGEFKVEDIENLLIAARADVPNINDEEFFRMGDAILTRYRNKNEEAINERIRALAEEEARKRALAEAERLRREEEERHAKENCQEGTRSGRSRRPSG